MTEKTTLSEAMHILAKTILEYNIPGMNPLDRKDLEKSLTDADASSIRVECRRAWGVSASLAVRVTGGFGTKKPHLQVDVSWPSTNHSPSQARAAVALISQVTDLACTLEAMILDFKNLEFNPE